MTAAEKVAEREPLHAVATFHFLAGDLQHSVNELCTFGILILGPIAARTNRPEDRIVWLDALSNGASPDTVHRSGLAIHQNGTGDESTTSGLFVKHIEALRAQIGMVSASGVEAVLIQADFA